MSGGDDAGLHPRGRLRKPVTIWIIRFSNNIMNLKIF
jgi:hypothetical protein